jgi:2',3'-cyclic-nucleotide 2'-phosphodiesterase (5'-nucleotidase family)
LRGTFKRLLLEVTVVLKKTFVRAILPFLALALLLPACAPGARPASADLREITILYTNDEHGWIAAGEEHGGAAGMLGLWRAAGYTEDAAYLVLSGGDTWTGPAISSWFDGEPAVDLMNAMGYDAVAVGNHEFDFGLDGLRERAAQAEFSFLAANIRDATTGEPVDFALPYVVQDVGGVPVGVIGLASLETPETTMPTYVAGLTFVPYAEALAEAVPQARADGAALIVVVGHLCSPEMIALAPAAADLGVAMIGGGHCHESFQREVQGVQLIEAGAYMRAYARVDLVFDVAAEQVRSVDAAIVRNTAGEPDAEATALVARWQAEVDEALLHVIGYTERKIGQRSPTMFNLVTDAWLDAYPADIAMSNPGGFRQDLPAGEITLADVVGVLPFDNVLVDVELTGAQVIASYEHSGARRPAIAGMTARGGYKLRDGSPIDPEATYRVLVNDFMYAGGDGYRFNEYDPDAYVTGIDWRQPVIDWISALGTTEADPLDNYVDATPR